MTKPPLFNTRLLFGLFLCAMVVTAICLVTPEGALRPATCYADNMSPSVWLGTAPSKVPPDEDPAGWLGTYNATFRMHNASIITTVFGSAFVAFFIAISWGKLVELYGALGGLIGGGAIVGTFWVLNHQLPGFGIGHDGFPRMDGLEGNYQYGLIVQTGPWIDMGLAVCTGLFVTTFLERLRANKLDSSQPDGSTLLAEVFPRSISVILGGMAGGAIAGLVGFTGARLF